MAVRARDVRKLIAHVGRLPVWWQMLGDGQRIARGCRCFRLRHRTLLWPFQPGPRLASPLPALSTPAWNRTASRAVAGARYLQMGVVALRAMEAVAVARRRLPPGGIVPDDHAFQGRGMDGHPVDVRLSELLAPGKDSLVIYSMMFPRDPGDERPGSRGVKLRSCPSRRAGTIVHRLARSARGYDGACLPARQPRGRREGATATHSRLRQRARLAQTAPAVLGPHHL